MSSLSSSSSPSSSSSTCCFSSPKSSLGKFQAPLKKHDERAPLLDADTAPLSTNAVEREELKYFSFPSENDYAPLPRLQIFLLCYCRVIEPIMYFTIFPYINFMIESVGGVNQEDVGFYSGLIESLFSVTQMCVMIPLGRVADRFGRKPVLVFSLFGVALMSTLFGMSQSLWQMILCRSLGGVFAGTIVTVRTMITENSNKKNQALAFSYFAFAGNAAIFIGPLIGGTLERPAEKFKSTFGHIQFFIDNPYALPGFGTALLSLSAAIMASLFLKETLHVHQEKKSDIAPMSMLQLFQYPSVKRIISIYSYAYLLMYSYTAVNSIFQYTPIDLGGTGFQPEVIAAAIGLGGASQAIWLLFVFPPLHKRFGTGRILRFCTCLWPLFIAMNPLGNAFLRFNLRIPFMITFLTNNFAGCGAVMVFTAVQIAIADIVPSQTTIGTLNSFALAIQSALRAFIPATATAIFAIGVKNHILWGQLFWIILFVTSFGYRYIVSYLPEEAEGGPLLEEESYA